MLLKGCQSSEMEKKGRTIGNKQHRIAANAMKLTTGASSPRGQRKVVQRVASKRPAPGKRIAVHGVAMAPAVDPCDSSNDSGLGFEHHSELHLARSAVRFSDQELHWANHGTAVKRKKVEIKLESDDANDNFTFEETISQAKRDPLHAELLLPLTTRLTPARAPVARVVSRRPGVTTVPRRGGAPAAAAANQQLAFSRGAVKPHLQILSQPEQQHRARYQTEGSRGAVKDRTGNSFPAVKLVGFEGQATLQVFIGSDLGRVVPHMFYQACRVSGKNSTPCSEKTVDGTVVIEVEFDAAKDMIVTCDCVGILKERNVDVEHRFPDQSGSRNKKKSTRCRMVFRTVITHTDGSKETLEITSQPIVCTQPPGIPEICKKSLSSCPCTGGQELFILGKNFLKDTCVLFTSTDAQASWEVSVTPDKEYLQQSHLVCVVPAYRDTTLSAPVSVRVSVTSSGKTSESHSFAYTPLSPAGNCEEAQNGVTEVQSGTNQPAGTETTDRLPTLGGIARPANTQYLFVQSAQGGGKDAVFLWKPQPTESSKLVVEEASVKPVSPARQARPVYLVGHIPATQKSGAEDRSHSPTLPRSPTQGMEVLASSMLAAMPTETASDNHPSLLTNLNLMPMKEDFTNMKVMEQFSTTNIDMQLSSIQHANSIKTSSAQPELHYPPSNPVVPMATGADLSSTQSPSLATLRRFVSSENTGSPLPSLSVEKFLSGLEHKTGESSPQKTLPLFADSLLRSTLSARKDENHNHPIDDNESQPMPPPPETNLVRADDPSVYQPQQPLVDSMSISHAAITSFGDHLMQAQLMLHGEPTTTTTMTTANSQNASSNLISATQNARLDALVSSAMDTHSAPPATQTDSQKLELLLTCAAGAHLGPPLDKDVSLTCLPQASAATMPLMLSDHIFPECVPVGEATASLIKSDEDVDAESGKLQVGGGMMLAPDVFVSSLHPASLPSDQLISSPMGELLCGVATTMALGATDAMTVDGASSMMHSVQGALISSAISPGASDARMIVAQCPTNSPILLNSAAAPLMEPPRLLPSMALTDMMMQSASASPSLFHPVQTSTAMQTSMLLTGNAESAGGRQLPRTPETVRLDALVNSALDAHILPAVAEAAESKCEMFAGTSAAECHAVGGCFAPVMHFAGGATLEDGGRGLALEKVKCGGVAAQPTSQEKREEVMVPRELTQMSENDLLSYINPSCFDTL